YLSRQERRFRVCTRCENLHVAVLGMDPEAVMSSTKSFAKIRRSNNGARLVAAHSAPDCGIRQWLIGDSLQMAKVAEEILIAAPDEITVLITGEPGTGKELAAHALHYNSQRSKGSFIVVNCGGFTESLLESELFGYDKGAFTGAVSSRKGLFE